MTELLPCPFCGGKARLGKWVSGHTPPEETWLVQCGALGCYARVGTTEEDQADAIATWNTRATTPTASELVEALRNIREKASQGMSHGLTADAICEDILRLADAALATEAGRSALKQEGK
jgi:Lar family restriction alleviation protein